MNELIAGGGGVARSPSALRQIRLRAAAVAASFGWHALLAIVLVLYHGGTEQTSSSSTSADGSVLSTPGTVTALTIYQVNPVPVTVILLALLAVCVVGLFSLRYRVVRSSPKLGVTALVAAILTGLLALLGLMSVGIGILPLAVCLTIVALPLDRIGG